MDDLTKCTGEGCPLRYDCHRFKSIASYKEQYFFSEIPYNHKLNTCEYIWNDNAEWLYRELNRITKPTN
jgi:hypothetical protein